MSNILYVSEGHIVGFVFLPFTLISWTKPQITTILILLLTGFIQTSVFFVEVATELRRKLNLKWIPQI